MEPSALDATNGITFEVLAEIAAGDTARVDLCKLTLPRERAGEFIAVKRLHPHVADDPTFIKQFLDEVRITHWLRHPNVVEVAGWGTDRQGSYLAVELVQGVSLLRLMKTVFETREAFSERLVVYVGSRVCRGLAAAHSLRAPNGELLHLVHRDLTPGNVLVGFNGEVKITDFGMAKATQRLTQTLTGMRKGEPTYMAPEQATLDLVDARADLFSLGVMLFELFAGRRPWIAKNDLQMLQITARDPPADLAELRPKIDPQLVTIVRRCLEREPGARWQTAEEIAHRLEEWLALHGYQDGNEEALARFVRRNAMRQMRWFERAVSGGLTGEKTRDVPRVPTYTDDSQLPPDLSAASMRVPPAAPGAARSPNPPLPRPSSTGRPLPPRPADPRSLRAANAVQQLKKLAPPVEPKPRPNASRERRRLPTLDEGETDVELRIPTNRIATLQTMIPVDDDDGEETGEEAPTLVQPDHPKIASMRAEARKLSGPAPRLGAPSVSLVDDFEDRTTSVKRQPKSAPASSGGVGAIDERGEIPTLLVDDEDHPTRPRADVYVPPLPAPAEPRSPSRDQPDQAAVAMGNPIASEPLSTSFPPNPSAPGALRTTSRQGPLETPRAPPPRVIPRSPDIPQRHKLPGANQPRAAATRSTAEDDALVLDRDGLAEPQAPPPEHLRAVAEADREAIVAEADRFAIEAVRCSEEARAAQLRAERKTVAARVAAEAARIAGDAVRLLAADGAAAAHARLEEARLASKATDVPVAPSVAPPVAQTAPPIVTGVAASVPAPAFTASSSSPPPNPAWGSPVAPTPAVSLGALGRPSPFGGSSAAAPPPNVAASPARGLASTPPVPSPLAPLADGDAFRAQLKPSFLGMGAAAGGIAVCGVLVVVVVIVALLGR